MYLTYVYHKFVIQYGANS